MKFIAVSIVIFYIIFCSFSLQDLSAAPNKNHSHDGREHSHALPLTGIKHYHKHMHEGRAHIHPYSAEIGFKHSHNKSPRAKAWANTVKHEHGGRPHSHPLPRSGIKHQHKHRHGGRTHIHPLPIDGASHFHQSNKNPIDQKALTPNINSWNLKQQASALLKATSLNKSKAIEILVLPPKRSANKRATTTKKEIDLRDKKYLKLLNIQNQNTKKTSNKKTVKKQSLVKRVPLKIVKKPKTIKAKPKLKKVQIPNQKKIESVKPLKAISTPNRSSSKIAEGNRQFNLALRYENGTGVKQNYPQAVNWYLRSAKQGNTKAQFNLATLYEQGKGVARDIPQAIRWYTTAAKNGDANAQINLGNRYAQGINVPKNIQEAAKWYKRAADQGNVRARANLNYLIESNNGVIKR